MEWKGGVLQAMRERTEGMHLDGRVEGNDERKVLEELETR